MLAIKIKLQLKLYLSKFNIVTKHIDNQFLLYQCLLCAMRIQLVFCFQIITILNIVIRYLLDYSTEYYVFVSGFRALTLKEVSYKLYIRNYIYWFLISPLIIMNDFWKILWSFSVLDLSFIKFYRSNWILRTILE